MQTRYCVKWRASEGKLVLKITNDTTVSNRLCRQIAQLMALKCIKFKTYSSIFLNRFEALNLSLMQKMQNRKPPQQTDVGSATHPDGTSHAVQDAATTSQSIPISAGTSGGVKKKKPKKKK